MNSLARKFYEKDGEPNFQEVLFLCDEKDANWTDLSERAPDLPRAWFELSRILPEERIEFTRDYWFDLLPYNPSAHPALIEFFSRLDDVALVIARKEDEWQPEMVYSMADNSTFFRGFPSVTEEDLREFRIEIGTLLPRDYLSFLRLHNGFGKLSEMGILKIEDIGMTRQRVNDLLLHAEKPVKTKGRPVDPSALIPFFEAFGLSSFQCFYADWYPGSEMGNVYLSGIDYTISDTSDRRSWSDHLAFPTFLEWLTKYLEGMNLSL